MEGFSVNKLRAIAFLGHSKCGKTTLVDSILHKTGANSRFGKVDDGTSLSDYDPVEIERKISITAKILNAQWKDKFIYLLDTPGYSDFISEVYLALRAVDAAILLINATSGIEVSTERMWSMLNNRGLARIIFVNRLDKENTDFTKILKEINERFGKNCVPIYYPFGKQTSFSENINLLTKEGFDKLNGQDQALAEKFRESLIDTIAESDDRLIEKYLAGEQLSNEEIIQGVRNAVIARKLIPVICGSAEKEIGTVELLDAVINFLPDPTQGPQMFVKEPDKEEEKPLAVSTDAPFSAFVFKTISDPYVGQLSLFKIFTGTLESNTEFYNVTKQTKEKIGQLYILQGKEQKSVATISAGDIACVAKLKDTEINNSLSDNKHQIIFKETQKFEPAISFSLKPKTRQDEEKISQALHKLAAEDQAFKVGRDTQTKELIISGMGDLHLEIMIQHLKQRYKVEVEVGVPKVPYKETIKKKVQVQGKYKKQSGGRGQYGDVWLELEPLPHGEDFEFVNKVVGGAVPRQYIPSVEKGVKNAMQEGVIAGYPVVDVRVTIYDGSYHTVDSSDMAFQIAGSMAFKKAVQEAGPVLLEPIMEVSVIVPEEMTGAVNGDLNSRRGRIMGIDSKTNYQVITAEVPQAEMLKYASDLRSLTQGRGSYSMHFTHYEEVPGRIAEKIIAQEKAAKEAK
ncbi:MAG: elongation factor G [Candidatus Omnitrophota bacterium]